jgi:hypothetical protein
MRNTMLALLLATVAVPALAADDPYKVKLLLGGGYQLGSPEFDQTLSFDQFQEQATIATSYSADKALGLDVGIQWNAFRSIGFQVAGTLYDRDLAGTWNASFPHPFFFDQPRTATGDVTGKMKETAGHLSLVFFGKSGNLDLSAWGGVSLFKVEADLLQNVEYSQAYPYDSVTVTSVPLGKGEDSPIGFNIGASVDYRFSKSIGLGVQGRFARAKAKLAAGGSPEVEVDAGGLQLGGGLRIYF